MEDSVLRVIDERTFEAMIRGNAEIAVRIIRKLAGRLDPATAQVEVLLLKDVNHRLAHYLRRVAVTGGAVQEGAGLRLDITVDELADRVGLDRAQMEDALDKLARARLLERNPDGRSLV